MSINTGNFAKAIAPGYRKVFFGTLRDHPTEYDKFMNISTSQRAYEEEFKVAGLGLLAAKPEGTSVTYDDAIEGNSKRFTHTAAGLGFRITEEMFEDDLYDLVGKKMAKSLAQSVANRCEVDGFSVLNNAFSTSYIGFNASESLCSTSHTLLGGGTVANRPTADTDLSLTALQAALESGANTVNERNIPALLKYKHLFVGPSFMWVAKELLGSELKPYTTDNEINPVKDEGLTWSLCHYFTDPDQFFLATDKDFHNVDFIWRRKPRYDASDDFDTGDAKNKVSIRTSFGFTDWRGWYGSQGA